MPRKAKEKKLESNNLIKGAKQKGDSGSTSSPKTTTKKRATTTKKKQSNTSLKATTKKTSSKTKKAPTIVEYYDLPFRYNQTVVKILAQTPNILFIYWDISDDDKNAYLQKYGSDFFQNTKPYLIITNETMQYHFEVEINDFANSWYLHVNDANCEYKVELGRKFVIDSSHSITSTPSESYTNYTTNEYLFITSSNEIEMPNNHILFDKLGKSVFFKNVKTNIVNEKEISSLSFLQKIGKVYHIHDIYKEIYKDELTSNEFRLNLPSSSNHPSFK